MRLSERWLHEWIQGDCCGDRLTERLIAAGIEVASIHKLALDEHVVVGRIAEIHPHPDADRLRVCRVDTGSGLLRSIVCGAQNAAEGLLVPTALPDAVLPGGITIRATEVRGVPSAGMLCSGHELGLEEQSSGLLVLPPGATPGSAVAEILGLPDRVLELELTPNRGDCLSVLGIARELAFLTGLPCKQAEATPVPVTTRKGPFVRVEATQACPRYSGRALYGLDPAALTPGWLQERLRRAGIRSIHPVVDVTNYVMIEWGQPLHAYALAAIEREVVVRHARQGEELALLDGRVVQVDAGTLLVADARRPMALAGIMGGVASSVSPGTQDVFLESAYFRPETIAWGARRLGINSDAAQRFERGVDPDLPARALAYATRLLIEIAGGRPGPVRLVQDRAQLPARAVIRLRLERIKRLLGAAPAPEIVDLLLRRLDPGVRRSGQTWRVRAPSQRFDLRSECDLVEEVARGWGYDQIQPSLPRVSLRPSAPAVTRLEENRVRHALQDRGYQEVLTYSFVDPVLEHFFDPSDRAPPLTNPLASQWTVMRTTLGSGLLTAAAYNRRRQQERMRLFETGRCFAGALEGAEQTPYVGFLALGGHAPRQWGQDARVVDFFDLKADLAALQALGHQRCWSLRPAELPGFHPSQGAEILYDGRVVGHIGTVHPEVLRHLDLDDNIVLCNVELPSILNAGVETYVEISRFPWIKRDLALVVRESIPVGQLVSTVREVAGNILADIEVFDEYRGEHIDSGRKSLGLTLTLQDSSRTLTEENVEAVVTQITAALFERYEARLRQ